MIDRQTTLIVWTLLATTLIFSQQAAVVSGGRFPGFGSVVGRVIERPAGRIVLVLAWMWLGWHAFAR
jgi:uncharacterized protein DUF6186